MGNVLGRSKGLMLGVVAIAGMGAGLGVAGMHPALNAEPTPVSTLNSSTDVVQATAEQALAIHLTSTANARMYGAYWCPYCQRQEELFGSAFSEIDYVECDPRGENARPELCQSAGISGFPTWEINGQLYPGMRSLPELAELSGYRGPRNFSN